MGRKILQFRKKDGNYPCAEATGISAYTPVRLDPRKGETNIKRRSHMDLDL